MTEPSARVVLVPVDPDDLAVIVEFLEATETTDEVIAELIATVQDDAVELPLETLLATTEVLHLVDSYEGLHLGGIGRALADPLERAVDVVAMAELREAAGSEVPCPMPSAPPYRDRGRRIPTTYRRSPS